MDYSKKTKQELIALCKERGIKGYSTKKKEDILALLSTATIVEAEAEAVGSPSENHYRVLSLFSGMGGMDIGFAEQVVVHKQSITDPSMIKESASASASPPDFVELQRLPFTIVFQNDILHEAKRIAELNHWDHNYHLRDIRDLLTENYEFPSADVVTGGFPCQDFSHAGKRQGLSSERGTLYQSFVEVVKRVKPLIFVAENVNGLLTMPGQPIQQIIRDFTAVGYDVIHQLIKCEEIGIPQTRWRVIIMGVRSDKRPLLSDEWNIVIENQVGCPVGDYFRHLEEPTNCNDPAQTVYSKAARLEKGQGQKEVLLTDFAPTIRAEHHGNIEFRRIQGGRNNEDHLPERRLTVREAALLQTFPPSCLLTEPGKPSSKAYKPIGNAVPPLLGYFIARKVHQILEKIK
jgi:DNA (cytosine-5)-methyltransferase 1